ncbi:MAG TPA: PilN domain-containing protein [Terriglobia bacterium]|nr:PilN domain-containing protein [Terriglobia bacterium]
MIKINLLPEGIKQVPTSEDAEASPLGISPVLLVAASAVVCFAIVGALGWYWSHDTSRIELEIKQERAEQLRLAAIQKESLLYQKQMEELEQRVRTIQVLQDSRTGPVDFLTVLGAVVNQTGDLYLVSVSPDSNGLVLKGQSQSVKSIAVFIAALKQSGSFADVRLRQYYQEDQGARRSFKFDLECAYQPPGTTQAAAGAEPPSAPANARSGS